MSDVVFLAHIPLLRVEAESAPFGHGDLWRMPFDHFDALTLGAFDRHRSDYEATAPVFYRAMLDINLPGLVPGTATSSGAIEVKAPSDDWGSMERVGLGYLERFQSVLVDPAWEALVMNRQDEPANAEDGQRLAHGAGWCGRNGSGSIFDEFTCKDRLFLTISLSKAYGAMGGAVVVPSAASKKSFSPYFPTTVPVKTVFVPESSSP